MTDPNPKAAPRKPDHGYGTRWHPATIVCPICKLRHSIDEAARENRLREKWR